MGLDLAGVVAELQAGGCVAAAEEADDLIEAAAGDVECLRGYLDRRLAGEPVAWIIGRTRFCGIDLRIAPGVYVPRWQTETIARRGVTHLPAAGTAVDLCTGCGAVAAALRRAQPTATVVAVDVDPGAVDCARSNGIDAFEGDLFDAIPAQLALELAGRLDLVVAVVPYVPRGALPRLARDTQRFEPSLALDGGDDGLDVLRTVINAAPRWLRPDGWLVAELGWGQVEAARAALVGQGFSFVAVLRDPDDDVCGVAASRQRTR